MPETSLSPECLLPVRSSLEMATLLTHLFPNMEAQIEELAMEVRRAGQLVLDAGSNARARTALERLNRARAALSELGGDKAQFFA